MNIYKFTNYQKCIKKIIENKKLKNLDICEKTNINPSYFSRVLGGNACFSSEQLFKISTHLGLNNEESEYLLLIREYQESNNFQYKSFLKKKIEAINEKKSKIVENITLDVTMKETDKLELYFRDSITAAVHMYLTLERYRNNPANLAEELNIPLETLKDILKHLELLDLIDYSGGKVTLKKSISHLDPNNPFARKNHINWRLEAIKSFQSRYYNPKDFSLSACFSTSLKIKNEIEESIKGLLVEIQQKIVNDKHDPEQVYFINLDLIKYK